jgi:formylglycine-generating enzyme required for sulfatase activity
MADIFISYASEDRSRAEILAKALEAQGWTVWWDRRITVGQSFEEVIEQALDEAKCVIAVWSAKAVKSKWVRAEAAEGFRRKILAPVLIEECNPPLLYRQLQTASLVGWDDTTTHSGFRQLIQDLSSILGSPEPKKAKELIKPATQELSEPTETFTNTIGMEFVLIPEGSFWMGSVGYKNKNEKPQHQVTISQPFYLQTTPVTQGQWQKVMRDNPSEFKDCGDNCPVESVSWDDVQDFINKLNKMEGAVNYRLPTEAEWEYACRVGSITEFFFGEDVDRLDDYAWYAENSDDKTHPVGQKEPNSYGLYDMAGNVWEWVEDDWHDNYEGAPPDGKAWFDNPRGSIRVRRGGSWSYDAQYCRSANRGYFMPGYRVNFVGFRLARSFVLNS